MDVLKAEFEAFTFTKIKQVVFCKTSSTQQKLGISLTSFYCAYSVCLSTSPQQQQHKRQGFCVPHSCDLPQSTRDLTLLITDIRSLLVNSLATADVSPSSAVLPVHTGLHQFRMLSEDEMSDHLILYSIFMRKLEEKIYQDLTLFDHRHQKFVG